MGAYFIHLLEGEGAGGGVRACCTLLLSVCMWGGGGGGANLNTVKRIATSHWNQTNIYINNSSEKSKYSDEPKNTLYFLF